MNQVEASNMQEAGTGFMLSSTDALKELQAKGYIENIVPHFDHFEIRSGAVKLYPEDIKVDQMLRFENTSDPDDQSILYAISSPSKKVKGVYIDSYGLNQDDLSPGIMACLKNCLH